ncbi:MAG: hypothetical protein H0V29_07995 [Thermoleophilaceae bacterium]|nr:hypothetical protein [Thermoleophilaceae bacterium]
MTASLEQRSEILKLARVLWVEPDSLAYLEKVDARDVKAFRLKAVDALFDDDEGALKRIADTSGHIPGGVAAKIGRKALGPVLSARITGLLEPEDAVEFAGHLPPEFLADIAVELDPRRAGGVLAAMPTDSVVEVADELQRRGEWVPMGRFLGHLPLATVAAVVATLSDEALLQIAFVLEDKKQLDDVIALLPAERHQSVIRAAAEHDLWPEALDLMAHVKKKRRRELVALAAAQDEDLLASLARSVEENGLEAELTALIELLPEEDRAAIGS